MQKICREETHGQNGQDLFSLEEESGRVEKGVAEKSWTARRNDRQVLQIININVVHRNGDLLIVDDCCGNQINQHF